LSGEAVALLSAALWACASVLFAKGAKQLHVVPLNLIRCVIATAFFWALLPLFGGLRAVAAIPLDQWFWLFLSVVMLLIVGDILYFRAMDLAGVSWAMPVASINPLWAVLLAAIFVDEPLSWTLLAGAVLVIVGLVLVGRSGNEQEAIGRRQQRIGLALALAASLAWGIGQVVLKPATAGLESVVANSVRQPMAVLTMLALSLARGKRGEVRQLDRRSWLVIVVGSLAGTGFGSLLFVLSIQMIGAGRTAVLTATAPLMAIPLAALWLGERPNRWTLVGALLAMAGIVLVA
jgi:drug/metabolite transporter, DME family